MLVQLDKTSCSLFNRRTARRPVVDLLQLACLFSAGQRAVNASYFDRGLILSVDRRHNLMERLSIDLLANKIEVDWKISCLRLNAVF